jgi:endonuclease/exonuclease/phosphatase family metal-dependent hydrolase
MRIASWNCNGGFGEKEKKAIMEIGADIYIIQECKKEECKKLNTPWFGDCKDSNRGIGIFSETFQFEPLFKEIKYRYVLPFKATGNGKEFTLFAVWTKGYLKEDNNGEYIQHVWKAITDSDFEKHLEHPTILIGDFNSNKIWDKVYKEGNHSAVEKLLKEKYTISDVYDSKKGRSEYPTLYWRYDLDAPFKVDYCFASDSFRVDDVEIGKYEDWVAPKLSDHCPIIVDLEWSYVK